MLAELAWGEVICADAPPSVRWHPQAKLKGKRNAIRVARSGFINGRITSFAGSDRLEAVNGFGDGK